MRKVWLVALVAAAIIGTEGPVAAGMRYMDRAPIVALVKHRVIAEKAQARRERIFERRRQEQRQERRAAIAAAEAEPEASTTVPSYSSSSSGAYRISEAEAAAAMRAAGFPESVIPYFLSTIIPRESGFCPTAVYPGHCGDVSLMVPGGPACSLFQLYTCPGPQAADPAVAARYAYAKYADSGLSPWR